jgi:membrane-bound ClpP family serine protease
MNRLAIGLWVVIGLIAGSGRAAAGPAADDATEPGIFVTVTNPITSTVVNQIKEAITRAEKRQELRKVIFDFNPDGREAATPEFGVCLDLATFIREKRGEGKLLTVAFVRNKVTRHTVLPVLACDELIMGPDGAIGQVAAGPGLTPNKTQLDVYTMFARPELRAIVKKMLDEKVEVVEGRRNDRAVWYVDLNDEEAAARDSVIIADRKPVLPAGSLALLRAHDAQKFQFCKAIRATRQQIEELYNMPPGSFRESVLLDRQPVVWHIPVQGEVNDSLKSSLERRIGRAIARGGNLIILQLECSGGSTITARNIAEQLRELKTPENLPVMTVAFIPNNAPDTATFLALGCHEIVMAKSARLGDFSGWSKQPIPVRRRGRPAEPAPAAIDLGAVRDSLVQLAERQGYSGPLIRGLFDRDLELFRAKRITGATQERRFLTQEELQEKDSEGKPVWMAEGGPVKSRGELLVLKGEVAQSLGLARHVIDKPEDVNEVYRFYGIEPTEVRHAMPDWVDRFASFFGDPFVSTFLVLLGITCLIIELKMPGVSVPGIIAAICFVLFFWAHSQLNGQITMLAVLLFLLGLVMLGIEIFVVPGFGVIGFSGVGLILFGLGLATMERMPQSSLEWQILGGAILKFGLALTGAIIAAFAFARFLPNIPVANRLVLMAPGENETEVTTSPHPDHVALLGAIGTAATMLRPAGMAKFGEQYVDVVTEGDFIAPGTSVQVVEIEGNRVVVKAT